jgi:hypothetical protein
LPAGAAGRKANLIRVLKATVKGPGAAPSTRLINGLDDQGHPTSAGNHPNFTQERAPPAGRHRGLSAIEG